ncbi:response regulator [Arhodomonas aquaeolei]|uniref:response regulator transcription factor n=1 Tax=Arhodomonas aquaeolei TaxID=2369 RepID=UPI002168FBB0|nr:response regulator [Arhodomonas aquaeolei]MCS4504917.1 response regulator [Arhodomonas aquaeolei]
MAEGPAVPTVFVVDDDPDVRDALAMLLTAAGRPVEAWASADAFLAGCGPERRGCLILDVRLPGMNGLTAQQELDSRGYTLPVIFISGHGDIPMAVRAVSAGALDFLEKPFSEMVVLDCVDRALVEDEHRRSERERIRGIERRLAQLTPREREVMDRLVEGKVNKIVARELDCSTRTVEIHRARVLHKMGVANVSQLVRYVLGHPDYPGAAAPAEEEESGG